MAADREYLRRFAMACVHTIHEELRSRGLGYDEASEFITDAMLLVAMGPTESRQAARIGFRIIDGGRA